MYADGGPSVQGGEDEKERKKNEGQVSPGHDPPCPPVHERIRQEKPRGKGRPERQGDSGDGAIHRQEGERRVEQQVARVGEDGRVRRGLHLAHGSGLPFGGGGGAGRGVARTSRACRVAWRRGELRGAGKGRCGRVHGRAAHGAGAGCAGHAARAGRGRLTNGSGGRRGRRARCAGLSAVRHGATSRLGSGLRGRCGRLLLAHADEYAAYGPVGLVGRLAELGQLLAVGVGDVRRQGHQGADHGSGVDHRGEPFLEGRALHHVSARAVFAHIREIGEHEGSRYHGGGEGHYGGALRLLEAQDEVGGLAQVPGQAPGPEAAGVEADSGHELAGERVDLTADHSASSCAGHRDGACLEIAGQEQLAHG